MHTSNVSGVLNDTLIREVVDEGYVSSGWDETEDLRHEPSDCECLTFALDEIAWWMRRSSPSTDRLGTAHLGCRRSYHPGPDGLPHWSDKVTFAAPGHPRTERHRGTGSTGRVMAQDLVAFYEEKAFNLKNKVEIEQRPMSDAPDFQSTEDAIRPGVVYVVKRAAMQRPVAVPVAAYDEWSLRSRYNEALRIMNVLGASEIVCEALREVGRRSRFRFRVLKQGTEAGLERVEGSTFDYHHRGIGSLPQDPGPLLWPEEPGFRAAITSVTVNGATAVELTIRSTNGYSGNADLLATIKKVGLDVGVRRESDKTTTLRIHATFPDPAKRVKKW